MSDLISRHEVIDMVKDWNLNQHIMNEEDALDDVNALPSAQPEPDGFTKWALSVADSYRTQPERKTGRWIPHPNKEFKEWDVCTACGIGCKRREYKDGGMTEYGYSYCPNCGAKMGVERE